MASVSADRLAALQALEDQALVIYAHAGDLDAFTILVERYHLGLYRFLARRLRNHELAEDLTQETFVDTFRHLGRCDPQRPFSAWLYGIARHRLGTEKRNWQVQRGISVELFSESTSESPPVLWESDTSESCQEQGLINAIFAEMSVPLREVLLLNCEQGFTALEIAQTLGISQSAAERRVSRAKQQFREAYVRLNGEAPC